MFAVLAIGLQTKAADGDKFVVDGLKYTVVSESERTAEVSGPVDKQIEKLVIPSSVLNGNTEYAVTAIGRNAFSSCLVLTSVSIPNSVVTVGQGAFFACPGLNEIGFSSSITSIESRAFSACSSLTKIAIPSAVIFIGDNAFTSCSNLTEIDIPSSVTSIGEGAFSACSGLTTVSIPASVTEMGANIFNLCNSLVEIQVEDGSKAFKSIDGALYSINEDILIACPCAKSGIFEIPASVTTVADRAFYGCEKLTDIVIPRSVKYIQDTAFRKCSGLVSVVIPMSVISIGNKVFMQCHNMKEIIVEEDNSSYASIEGVLYDSDMNCLIKCPEAKDGELVIPSSVTAISDDAFSDCNILTSVTLSNALTSIGRRAFQHCTGLSAVTIPNSVVVISDNAFAMCRALNLVILSSSLESIGRGAFSSCENLAKIYSLSSTPPLGAYDPFNGCPKDAVIYVPAGTADKYREDKWWSYFTDFREMGSLGITLSESSVSLVEDQSLAITATIVKDDDVTIESETWISSNPGVAAVANGVVTAIAEGAATIIYTVVDGYGLAHSESCQVTVSSNSGIENIVESDANAPVEYYNLQGVRVDAQSAGLYIRRQGNTTTKVLVK